MKNILPILAVIVAGGLVLTLYSSQIDTTPGGLVGATWHGWPSAYMYNLVTFPPATTYNYVNLVEDVVVWSIIAAVIAAVIRVARR